MNLNGMNIRKGLELEVPVADIFKNTTHAEGERAAKLIYGQGWNKAISEYPQLEALFEANGSTLSYYSEKKCLHVGKSLDVYEYDAYFVYRNEKGEVESYLEKRLDFVNVEMLEFSEFCQNLMMAQAYSGQYDQPQFKYSFMGIGNFEMSLYADVHQMTCRSNFHFLHFFLNHKKITSSIGLFITGLFDNDIEQQREYLSEEEYIELRIDLKRQRNIVTETIQSANELEPDEDDED